MKYIIIIILILIFIISFYYKNAYDKLSYEDIDDLEIVKQYSSVEPKKQINDYKFVTKDYYNVIYKNNSNNIVKIFIRGILNATDIVSVINYIFGNNNINKSPIYENTYRLLEGYKNNKIYIIGHSFGCCISEEITKNMKLDIVKKKYFCPFLFNIQELKNTHIVNYKYDPFSSFISKNNSKTIFRNIPLESSELFFIHDIIFVKNLYKNDTLFLMNKIVIIIIIFLFLFNG